jgi:hypothetical protein
MASKKKRLEKIQKQNVKNSDHYEFRSKKNSTCSGVSQEVIGKGGT